MRDSPSIRYPSLAMLQAAHNGLLKRQRQKGDAPAFLAEVAGFLREGTATGALLDADADRRTAQGLLDYWVARLYRVGEEPPDATPENTLVWMLELAPGSTRTLEYDFDADVKDVEGENGFEEGG